MDRQDFDQSVVEATAAHCATLYPGYEQPCPETNLKLYDDVMWLDLFPMRVVGGTDDPDYFNGHCPMMLGDDPNMYIGSDAHYITDRAPLDPLETPMPIYPEPMQARAAQADAKTQTAKPHKHDEKKALQHVLKQLTPERAKTVRELVKAKRPGLLDKDA